MLQGEDQGLPRQINLAIVGHIDSGKSTLCGRLLHALGRISKNQMQKMRKNRKKRGSGRLHMLGLWMRFQGYCHASRRVSCSESHRAGFIWFELGKSRGQHCCRFAGDRPYPCHVRWSSLPSRIPWS